MEYGRIRPYSILVEMNLEEKNPHPLWETLAMIGAFALVWAWFFARQSAIKAAAAQGIGAAQVSISPLWTLAQIAAVAVLILIFVRRMRRARAAMQELSLPRMPPGFDAYNSSQAPSKKGRR